MQVASTSPSIKKLNKFQQLDSFRFFSATSRLLSLQISKPAPDFSGTAVVKGDFKDIKLGDFKGKYVVLFFYPLDL